jgi:hypothetical protein
MKEGGRITLTASEQRRLIVLNQLEAGGLVNAEAAQLLNLSVRESAKLCGACGAHKFVRTMDWPFPMLGSR